MKRKSDECVECGVVPCLGAQCPNRNVIRYYCDNCDEEFYATQLYKYEGRELCIDCLSEQFETVADSDD